VIVRVDVDLAVFEKCFIDELVVHLRRDPAVRDRLARFRYDILAFVADLSGDFFVLSSIFSAQLLSLRRRLTRRSAHSFPFPSSAGTSVRENRRPLDIGLPKMSFVNGRSAVCKLEQRLNDASAALRRRRLSFWTLRDIRAVRSSCPDGLIALRWPH
jgi:hypothetical protein